MGTTELRTRGVNEKRLTDKKRAFVREYQLDYNGVRAVLAAGYSKNGAAVRACKLLQDPLVRAAIGKAEMESEKKVQIEKEDIIQELIYQSFRDPIDLVDPETGLINTNDLRKLPARIRKCIDGLKIKVHYNNEGDVVGQETELKFVPKLGSQELLAKMLGWFIEQHELNLQMAVEWKGLVRGEEPVPDLIEEKLLEVESRKK